MARIEARPLGPDDLPDVSFPISTGTIRGLKRSGSQLIALGALLTAFVLGPIVLIESGTLLPITSSYILMMVVPAAIAAAVLLYQRSRGPDLASIAVALLVGVVMSTIPFWGPSFDPGMTMPLEWIGTILGHYVAGASVVLGGLLQVRALKSR